MTKKGSVLYYEPISKTYFFSDPEEIRHVERRLNQRMNGNEMFIDINDYLCELCLHPDPKWNGIGWNRDEGIEIVPTHDFADDGVTPCAVLTTKPEARHGYGYDTHAS